MSMRAPGDGPPSHGPASARGAVLVGAAVILGIIGLQVLDDSGTTTSSTTPTGSTATTGGSSTTVAAAARPVAQVRVKVYNASGVQGQAQATSDKLKSLGWDTIEPADYGSIRQGTTVACRSGFERDAEVLVAYGVKGAKIEPYPTDPPAGAGDADCLVIEGKAA
jgi:hypothetical protein